MSSGRTAHFDLLLTAFVAHLPFFLQIFYRRDLVRSPAESVYSTFATFERLSFIFDANLDRGWRIFLDRV